VEEHTAHKSIFFLLPWQSSQRRRTSQAAPRRAAQLNVFTQLAQRKTDVAEKKLQYHYPRPAK